MKQHSWHNMCLSISMKKTALLILTSIMLNLCSQELIPCRAGKQWGYCDTGKIVKIRTEFDFADFFTGDIAFVQKDSLYHGINRKGEFITPALKRYGIFSSGLCPIQLANGTCYYIDQTGRVAFDTQYSAAENFSEGLAIVSVNKKLGIINTRGEWVRKPDLEFSSAYFKSGFLMGVSGGRYFYVNQYGKELLLPDSIQPAGIFSENLAGVYVTKTRTVRGKQEKTSYLEFIDTGGRIILQNFVNDSMNYSEYIMLEKEFIDGKAIIKTKNELGYDYYFLDKKGRFSPLYSSARHLGDSLFLGVIKYYMADVRIVDSNYYVAGQFQHMPKQVGEFGNGLLPFSDKDGKWGYVNSNCRVIIEPKYNAAFRFKNGYAYVVIDGQQGVIDTKGKEYFQ
jgi:hypothetical protein